VERHEIDRINELSRKSKCEGLSAEELEEQKTLREKFLAGFRNNLITQLENTYIVDEKGNKRKLKKRADKGSEDSNV
jgi:uncharacterized protein YnzC (UPF0291/DUF896 family)